MEIHNVGDTPHVIHITLGGEPSCTKQGGHYHTIYHATTAFAGVYHVRFGPAHSMQLMNDQC